MEPVTYTFKPLTTAVAPGISASEICYTGCSCLGGAPQRDGRATKPLKKPPVPDVCAFELAYTRCGDARLSRALQDSWAKPSRSERDLRVASATYSHYVDVQGIANVFLAHGERHREEVYLGNQSMVAENAARASSSYSAAATLYTKLLEGHPTRRGENGSVYNLSRQQVVHVALNRRMNPPPEAMAAFDTMVTAARGALG